MKLETTSYLFNYWNKLRGDEIAPERKELDPTLLKNVLPNLFLLDRKGAGEYNFRLAGTKTCNIFGEELKDKNFLSLWNKTDRDSFVSLLDTLSEQGAAIVCGLKAEAGDKLVEFEFLALPLFQGHKSYCSSVIGSFAYDKEIDDKFMLPISNIEMSSLRVIWPAERSVMTHNSVPKSNSKLKLAMIADVETDYVARRANFRVIEGGKS